MTQTECECVSEKQKSERGRDIRDIGDESRWASGLGNHNDIKWIRLLLLMSFRVLHSIGCALYTPRLCLVYDTKHKL